LKILFTPKRIRVVVRLTAPYGHVSSTHARTNFEADPPLHEGTQFEMKNKRPTPTNEHQKLPYEKPILHVLIGISYTSNKTSYDTREITGETRNFGS
jgi:hypothetical protein